ncbi:MAG: hypothetical protein ACLP01_32340 [Solirubrobacteraceae bacterium]
MIEESACGFDAPARSLTLDEHNGITFALFRERALQMQAFHSRAIRWPTELKRIPDLGVLLASGSNHRSQTHVVNLGAAVCRV